jgi:hypothetical protein
MKSRWLNALALGLGLATALAARAEPQAIAQQEINYLIRYIGDSGCEFGRNGIWNNGKAAEAHVRGKYEFLLNFGLIDATEDFIDKAATRSSLSGHAYEIRCGGDLSIPSSLWLSNALARYRASKQQSH